MIAVEADQTEAVYVAQALLLPSSFGKPLRTVPEIEAWAECLRRCRWFRHRHPHVLEIRVHDGRGQKMASGWLTDGEVCNISLPRALRNEFVVLHEIVHGVGFDSHDREYCAELLQLVRYRLGRDAWEDLVLNFKVADVRFRRPPRPFACELDFY